MQLFDTIVIVQPNGYPANGCTGPRLPLTDKIIFRKIVSYDTAVKKPFPLIRSDS